MSITESIVKIIPKYPQAASMMLTLSYITEKIKRYVANITAVIILSITRES
jgi:hypothetical protein